jgi:hypothetical protein
MIPSLFWQRAIGYYYFLSLAGVTAAFLLYCAGHRLSDTYFMICIFTMNSVLLLSIIVLRCPACHSRYSMHEMFRYGRCRKCVERFPEEDDDE